MVCFFCNSFVVIVNNNRKTNANIIFLYSAMEDNDQLKQLSWATFNISHQAKCSDHPTISCTRYFWTHTHPDNRLQITHYPVVLFYRMDAHPTFDGN